MKPLTTSRKFLSDFIWVPSFFPTSLILAFSKFPKLESRHIVYVVSISYTVYTKAVRCYIYSSLANAVRLSPSILSELPHSSKFFCCNRETWRNPASGSASSPHHTTTATFYRNTQTQELVSTHENTIPLDTVHIAHGRARKRHHQNPNDNGTQNTIPAIHVKHRNVLGCVLKR